MSIFKPGRLYDNQIARYTIAGKKIKRFTPKWYQSIFQTSQQNGQVLGNITQITTNDKLYIPQIKYKQLISNIYKQLYSNHKDKYTPHSDETDPSIQIYTDNSQYKSRLEQLFENKLWQSCSRTDTLLDFKQTNTNDQNYVTITFQPYSTGSLSSIILPAYISDISDQISPT